MCVTGGTVQLRGPPVPKGVTCFPLHHFFPAASTIRVRPLRSVLARIQDNDSWGSQLRLREKHIQKYTYYPITRDFGNSLERVWYKLTPHLSYILLYSFQTLYLLYGN